MKYSDYANAGGIAYHYLVGGHECPVSDIRYAVNARENQGTSICDWVSTAFVACITAALNVQLIKAKSRREQLRYSWRGSLHYAPTNATLLQSLPVQSSISYTTPALRVHPAHHQCNDMQWLSLPQYLYSVGVAFDKE